MERLKNREKIQQRDLVCNQQKLAAKLDLM